MSTLIYSINYNDIKSPRASIDSRRASASSSHSKASDNDKFTMKAALDQLKPTEEQIRPTGIYTPIIKRGSLFSFSRGKTSGAKSEKSRKHSHTQAHVDAALLR